MNRIEIITAQNVSVDFEEAGIGDRTMAAVIDYMILMSYIIGALFLIGALNIGTMWLSYVVISLPYLGYFLVAELLSNGRSIGKKLQRIKVARLDGAQPTAGDYIIRWLFRLIEIDLTFGLVAAVTLLLRGRGQRLGDLAAGTVVIREPRSVSLDETVYTRVDSGYETVFSQAELLDGEDIQLVREVLNLFDKDPPPRDGGQLAATLKDKLLKKMNTHSDLEPRLFLRTILKDFNRLRR